MRNLKIRNNNYNYTSFNLIFQLQIRCCIRNIGLTYSSRISFKFKMSDHRNKNEFKWVTNIIQR